jgi:RES domain-containing protein
MDVWRLTKKKHLATAMTGQGAKENGGRWNSIGTPIVYTSENIALSVLDTLANRDKLKTLRTVLILDIHIPDDLILSLDEALKKLSVRLNKYWYEEELDPRWVSSSQKVGNEWQKSGISCVLMVPNTIVRMEHNLLVNPDHLDFKRVKVKGEEPFSFDKRLA